MTRTFRIIVEFSQEIQPNDDPEVSRRHAARIAMRVQRETDAVVWLEEATRLQFDAGNITDLGAKSEAERES